MPTNCHFRSVIVKCYWLRVWLVWAALSQMYRYLAFNPLSPKRLILWIKARPHYVYQLVLSLSIWRLWSRNKPIYGLVTHGWSPMNAHRLEKSVIDWKTVQGGPLLGSFLFSGFQTCSIIWDVACCCFYTYKRTTFRPSWSVWYFTA